MNTQSLLFLTQAKEGWKVLICYSMHESIRICITHERMPFKSEVYLSKREWENRAAEYIKAEPTRAFPEWQSAAGIAQYIAECWKPTFGDKIELRNSEDATF